MLHRLLIVAAPAFVLASCSPNDRVLSQLKAGSPEVCGSPQIVQTLVQLVQDRQTVTTYKPSSTPDRTGMEGTLTQEEMGVVEKARPVSLTNVTAERAYRDVSKMECLASVGFDSPAGPISKRVSYTVLPDAISKKVGLRSSDVGDAASSYADNYTSAAYRAITGKQSASQIEGDRLDRAQADKVEHHPDFDESLIDATKPYEVDAPSLDATTRRHFGWMRAHCKDPSEGRQMTSWMLGGENSQNVRSIYLKLKGEHPELLTQADAKCYAEEDRGYRGYLENQKAEAEMLRQ